MNAFVVGSYNHNAVDIGDSVQYEARFYDAAGLLVDPTEVYFRLRIPSGTEEQYKYGVQPALVRDSTGVYHLLRRAVTAGEYNYRWIGLEVGSVDDDVVAEHMHIIRETAFTIPLEQP